MSVRRLALAAVLAGAGWSLSASAAPIIATYDFTENFQAGPYTTITGSIQILYDPLVASSGPTPVLNFTSNLPATYLPVEFYHDNSGFIVFGNNSAPVTDPNNTFNFYYTMFNVNQILNEFAGAFGINPDGSVSSASNQLGFIYATSSTHGVFVATGINVTEVSAVPYVPDVPDVTVSEPTSIALLGMGLLGLTLALRRQRT